MVKTCQTHGISKYIHGLNKKVANSCNLNHHQSPILMGCWLICHTVIYHHLRSSKSPLPQVQKQQEEARRLRILIADLQGELEVKMPQLEAVRDAERCLGSGRQKGQGRWLETVGNKLETGNSWFCCFIWPFQPASLFLALLPFETFVTKEEGKSPCRDSTDLQGN